VAQKYGLEYKRESSKLDDVELGEIGDEDVESDSRNEQTENKEEDEVETKRGFKYFLYHHHSFLGIFCVKHANDLPRYARFFLFVFNLLTSLLFSLVFSAAGMSIAPRVFLTVFFTLVINIFMMVLLKGCGFGIFLKGENRCTEFIFVSLFMLVPSAVFIAVIIVFAQRQPDNGQMALILFAVSQTLSLFGEILAWYVVYDCCKSMCSCCLRCCPDLLDDGEEAVDDKKRKKRKMEKKEKQMEV